MRHCEGSLGSRGGSTRALEARRGEARWDRVFAVRATMTCEDDLIDMGLDLKIMTFIALADQE